MASAARSTIADLRVLLRGASLPPRRPDGVLQTGVEAVDALLGGGLPRGRMTVLSGRRSAGRTALALQALAAATKRGEATALVDVGGALDVRRAEAAGCELARLLWARAADARLGAQAADLVLGAGGFTLVVLDLGEQPPRLPDASFIRLGRAAERAGAALVVIAPPTGAASVPSGVGTTLQVEASRREAPRFFAVTERSPRVLTALEADLTIVRSKHGGEGDASSVELRLR